MSNKMTLLPILLAAVFLGTGNQLTGAFSSDSGLVIRAV